jgi:DNA-binding response OmpR family regulator
MATYMSSPARPVWMSTMPFRTMATVLVIEREPQVRQLVREILDRAGFSVLHARNAEGGLRLYEQHRSAIDLLLVDAHPPEIAELTARHPGLKILGLSGSGGSDFSNGMPVLAKPFTPDALVGAVRMLLESAASRSC